MADSILRSERLDPEARAILEKLDAEGAPPVEMQDPVKVRPARVERAKLVGGAVIPLARVENLAIPGPGGPVSIRIYSSEVAEFGPRWFTFMAADSSSATSKPTTQYAARWRMSPAQS